MIKKTRFLNYLLLWTFLSSCGSYLHPTHTAHKMTVIDNRIEMDTAIVNYYMPYKQQLTEEMETVVGYSKYHLTRNRTAPESLAGNFFADALLEIGKKIDPESIVAFGTKDGVRADLKKGAITVGSIFEIMPFENYLTILSLSGQDLLLLGDFIAATGGQPISGMTVRIAKGKAMEIKVNGKDIDPKKTYKLVTYDYIANGGDRVEGVQQPTARRDTDIRLREGLIDYVRKLNEANEQVETTLDGRVKIDE